MAPAFATAVDTLRGRKAWRRPHQAADVQRAGRIDPEAPTDAALATIRQAQDARLDEFGENIRHYKTLRDAARLLGTDAARRKAFVLVSEGIGKDLPGLFGAMSPQAPRLESGSEYAFGDVAAALHDPGERDRWHRDRASRVGVRDPVTRRALLRSIQLRLTCRDAPGRADYNTVVREHDGWEGSVLIVQSKRLQPARPNAPAAT